MRAYLIQAMLEGQCVPEGVILDDQASLHRIAMAERIRVPVPLIPTHRHYKGGLYSLIGHGMHTETEERLTAYWGTNGLFFRPTEMFHSRVEVDAGIMGINDVPRFVLL
jgi:hypothetical protein